MMHQAHSTAYLHRVKEFPTFDRFMGRVIEQTADEMWSGVMAFVKAGEQEFEEGAEDG